MHRTPPTAEEIDQHVRFAMSEIKALLAERGIAASVEPHVLRGFRRVIVSLDLSGPLRGKST